MPAIFAALLRFIALLVGVLFAAVGLSSPVEHWENSESIDESYRVAQTEFDAIIGSSAKIGTSSVLEAIVRAADGPREIQIPSADNLVPFVATSTPTSSAPQKTPNIPVTVPKTPITQPATTPPPVPVAPITPTAPVVVPPQTIPTQPTEPVTTTTKSLDLSDILPTFTTSKPESAVVRISCVKETGSSMELQNGSGVIISPKGYVLTNSHVAFPISEGTFDCIVTEAANPSVGYEPDVVYISQDWLKIFAKDMRRGALPAHTGENDIAILKLTKSVNPAIPLPKAFPYIKISEKEPSVGDRIKTWGYPAARSGNLLDDLSNPIVSDSAKIAALYSFIGGGMDVIETTNTSTARQGSSGGAILSSGGELVGLTAAIIERGNESVITGLTMSYVQEHLKSNGLKLDTYTK